jgi:hypothetical protein
MDDGDMAPGEFEAAGARGESLMRGPRAESVHYDAGRDMIVVRLVSGAEVEFSPRNAQGWTEATPEELAGVEVDALGLAVRVDVIDADLYVPALVEGRLGSDHWIEQRKAGAASMRAG